MQLSAIAIEYLNLNGVLLDFSFSLNTLKPTKMKNHLGASLIKIGLLSNTNYRLLIHFQSIILKMFMATL